MSIRSRIRRAEEARASGVTPDNRQDIDTTDDDGPTTMTVLDLVEEEARRAMPALVEQIRMALLRASIDEAPEPRSKIPHRTARLGALRDGS